MARFFVSGVSGACLGTPCVDSLGEFRCLCSCLNREPKNSWKNAGNKKGGIRKIPVHFFRCLVQRGNARTVKEHHLLGN